MLGFTVPRIPFHVLRSHVRTLPPRTLVHSHVRTFARSHARTLAYSHVRTLVRSHAPTLVHSHAALLELAEREREREVHVICRLRRFRRFEFGENVIRWGKEIWEWKKR